MTQEEAKKTFLSYAQAIKEMGFRVFVSKRGNYGWIVNDKDQIGSFDYRPYEGIKLSTIHKPCLSCGTGFRVGECTNPDVLTKEQIEQVFIKAPFWGQHYVSISKRTATEYFQNYWDKDNVEEI